MDVPSPSRFIKHDVVDEIASDLNLQHRSEATRELCFDVESFTKNVLQRPVVWEPIQEPPNRVCFASITDERITLNENHRGLFATIPFLIRSCLSHEIGHDTLRHLELLRANDAQGNLFTAASVQEKTNFHDSRLAGLGLDREEIAELKADLAREAISDPNSYNLLKTLEDKLEPEWMFWQAEQFAACFLLPKDRVLDYLETGIDLSRWPALYGIAEDFGVSCSMVKIRLEKLKIIKVTGKTIEVLPKDQRSIAFTFADGA